MMVGLVKRSVEAIGLTMQQEKAHSKNSLSFAQARRVTIKKWSAVRGLDTKGTQISSSATCQPQHQPFPQNVRDVSVNQ